MTLDLGVPRTALASGIEVHHGVEFAVLEYYRPLLLDLYVPPSGLRSGAAIVYLHGGGWAVGSRRRFGRAFAEWSPTPFDLLAQAGFVVASVDYRLSGEARFPAQLDDVKAAIAWLREHAIEIGVDGSRIVTWGESAGGHLAMLAGLTDEHVCGIIDWYGPMNLLSLGIQHGPNSDKRPDDAGSWESALVGAPLQEQPDRTRAASPISHVHAGAPPIQIHHGNADTLVPFAQSVEFVEALRAAGGDCEFVEVPGADHFWTGAPSLEQIFQSSLRFAQAAAGVSGELRTPG
jgi:acetyl esterase/lipase